MRIDVTKPEFEAIVNRLRGLRLKSEQQLVDKLAQRLDWQLHPSKAPPSNGWAPIRIKSNWPSNKNEPNKNPHWSFHKPKKSKPKGQLELKLKKKPTADDILAAI